MGKAKKKKTARGSEETVARGPAVQTAKRSVDLFLLLICLLALALRLVGLTDPLVDEQEWRQTDTAAIARNYFEEGYDFLYPRVDWRGDTSGFVEMELPLHPFLVACLYALIGGPQEWAGRIVSAVFSVLTIPLLYRLAKDFHDPIAARIAVFFFTIAPLNAFFGRAFMPESAMLFFSVGAILFFHRWTVEDRWHDFVAAALFTALAILVKLPTLYLGLPLAFLAYERFGWQLFRQLSIWVYGFVSLIPPLLWYWHAYELFLETGLTFGTWHGSGYPKWGQLDLLASGEFYRLMLGRLGGVTLTPVGLILLVYGVAMKRRTPRELVFHVWLAALVVYVLLVPEGNKTLKYYQLPFVPVAAVFAGKALATLWTDRFRSRRIAAVTLLALTTALSYRYAAPLFEPVPYNVARYVLGRRIDRTIPRDTLLVVGDVDANTDADHRTQSPTLLYYSGRKGWQILPKEFQDSERVRSLIERGAQFLLFPDLLRYDPTQATVIMTLLDSEGRILSRLEHRTGTGPRPSD